MATLSLIFCIGLVVIFVQGPIRLHLSKERRMDDRLDLISEKLCRNIKSDLSHIFTLYNQVTDERRQNQWQHEIRDLIREMKDTGYANVFELDTLLFPEDKNDTCHLPIPVNDILFIDRNGFSRKMATKNYKRYKQYDVPDLGDRDYYRVIQEGRPPYLWDTVPYFMESIMAYTSGRGEAAISFPHKETFVIRDSTFETGILAITSPIPSLFNQVIPSDVQFTIIDPSGKTLFHSERNRNLHENFFEEVERTNFRSYMENNLSEKEWIIYHGRDWRAMIRPIDPYIPLYLITLIDDNRAQEAHTRIILHTFILFLTYIVVIFLGTLIINFTRPKNLFLKQKQYNFVWLFFTGKKVDEYKRLIVKFFFLICAQIAGYVLYEGIGELLLIHSTVISFSALYGLKLLDQGLNQDTHSNWNPGVWVLSGISTLLILSLTILISPPDFTGDNLSLYLPILLILFSLPSYTKVKEISVTRFENLLKRVNVKLSIFNYRVFMGSWLILLTVVPAAHMMYVVSKQDDFLWARHELKQLADRNASILARYNPPSDLEAPDWFGRLQGNDLEGYEIHLVPNETIPYGKATKQTCKFNRTFPSKLLPDIHINLDPFFVDTTCFNAVIYDGDSTVYQKLTSTDSRLKVFRSQSESSMGQHNLVWYLLITFIVVIALIYIIIIYLLNQLMYIDFGNWIKKKTPDWEEWLKNTGYRKIILVSMNSQRYISKSEQSGLKPIAVHFDDLFPENGGIPMVRVKRGDPDPIIFITGLEWHIYDVSKHTTYLEKVERFMRSTDQRIVVCSPFEFDYIKMVIYRYYGGERMQKEQQNNYLHLLSRWEAIFQRFYKFNGTLVELNEDPPEKPTLNYILERELIIAPELIDTVRSNLEPGMEGDKPLTADQRREVEVLILGIQHLLEPKYYSIWNSCTDMEKLMLYDLADDGMANLKNRFLINKMVTNNLILRNPYPRIFSESFRNFILTSVREEEIKELEITVRRSGNWNSIRFFYLTIFLALAMFLIVIQGTSVDRAMAIITSILAFFPALLKMFNNLLDVPRESKPFSPRPSQKATAG
jgi:hypothetical protein